MKLFIEHKIVIFDVGPFIFYVLWVERENDPNKLELAGYFAKEKRKNSIFNLACIAVLPQHRELGLGRLLIEL